MNKRFGFWALFLMFIYINSCETGLTGKIFKQSWRDYGNLSTFEVNTNELITSEFVEISTPIPQCMTNPWIRCFTELNSTYYSVKGFRMVHRRNIQYLPVNVAKTFPALMGYSVNNCSIKEIGPKHFENLKELRVIFVVYNQLTFIPDGTFKDLSNLKWLALYNNNIQRIEDFYFQDLTNLQTLDLEDNKISYLSKNAFATLRKLQNIYLTDNNLQFLEFDLFRNNEKLEYVYLGNNMIQKLQADIFDEMKNLNYVDLTNNTCIHDYFYGPRIPEMRKYIEDDC